ncbi:MAG TPA: YdcF family protein, partial [Clostridiales bacterium]|nr:YdcF family protein [Clostridiales bacterium]
MIWHIDSALLRTIFSVLSLIGLVIFINPILLGICNLGNVSASIAFLLLSIFFIFNKTIASLLDRLWMHSIGKIIIITVIGFIILGLILVTIISAFMINAANDYPEESNIVVVLGCKVNGTTPSLMLTKRLEATYDYLIENEDVLVIVSGGQGEYEDISEAQCMKDYLIGKGISDDRIIMEDKSTS